MIKEIRPILREHRNALLFILKFVGLYLFLNTFYGIFIQSYYPAPDPATILVAEHTTHFLSIFSGSLECRTTSASPYVTIIKNGKSVLDIFEGCNAINVFIVFVSFVFAFGGRKSLLFVGVGMAVLYCVNLLRIAMLYWVAIYEPSSMYFFHKFLFTAVIYAVVIGLWFYWVKHGRKLDARTKAA